VRRRRRREGAEEGGAEADGRDGGRSVEPALGREVQKEARTQLDLAVKGQVEADGAQGRRHGASGDLVRGGAHAVKPIELGVAHGAVRALRLHDLLEHLHDREGKDEVPSVVDEMTIYADASRRGTVIALCLARLS
jgi:hypothetical protein